jgi:hypothetical protein
MTRSGGADEGDFQTGGQGGHDAGLDAVLSGAPAGVLEWRVLGRGAEGRHRTLRGPLTRERTVCRRVDAAGRPLGSCAGNGMALAIVFRSVGLTCRR